MLRILKARLNRSNVGCVNQRERLIGLKLRLIILFTTLIFASGCTEFAILMSGSSLAISQNAYAKMYNGADFLTVISTEKSIKKHIYENTIKTLRNSKRSELKLD